MDAKRGSVAVDVARANSHPSEPRRVGRVRDLTRFVGFLLIATVVVACGSGLGGTEWLWCKAHLTSVDAAAEGLQVAKVHIKVQEPSWWIDYETSMLNSNNALLAGNADFMAACDAAAAKRGVGESRISWCMADGLGDVWDSSIALGLMVDIEADTFAYNGLPLEQRLNNEDFVRACRAAFTSRTD